VALIALVILSPVYLILAIAIKIDSPGPVFYRQERVTQYGKRFRIHKFRTMVQNADKGAQVTVNNDSRITRVGRVIRNCRLDEIAQLLDVIQGTVTLVGVRPESPKYVAAYTDEMMATLLLPAGVTSLASIYYKDEAKLLEGVEDVDKAYIEDILPAKMYYNLKGIEKFSFFGDIKIMFMTVFAVLGKEYKGDHEVVREKEEVQL
jgi:lipopolysaccharide/colanic/teichoic acid biosynthesis glycosyltransferase